MALAAYVGTAKLTAAAVRDGDLDARQAVGVLNNARSMWSQPETLRGLVAALMVDPGAGGNP